MYAFSSIDSVIRIKCKILSLAIKVFLGAGCCPLSNLISPHWLLGLWCSIFPKLHTRHSAIRPCSLSLPFLNMSLCWDFFPCRIFLPTLLWVTPDLCTLPFGLLGWVSLTHAIPLHQTPSMTCTKVLPLSSSLVSLTGTTSHSGCMLSAAVQLLSALSSTVYRFSPSALLPYHCKMITLLWGITNHIFISVSQAKRKEAVGRGGLLFSN